MERSSQPQIKINVKPHLNLGNALVPLSPVRWVHREDYLVADECISILVRAKCN